MTTAEPGARALPDRRGRTPLLFALTVGFLAGVLVTTLVAPRSPEVVIDGQALGSQVQSPGTAEPTQAEGGTSDAGPTEPGEAGSNDLTAPRGGAAGPGPDAPTTTGTSDGGDGTDDGTPGSSGADAGTSPGSTQPTTGGEQGNGGATARGVTADTIRIGVGVLDIGALRNLGPEFDNGDVREQMEAWLEGVRRDGLVPIHGRDLEFVYREYSPAQLDVSSQREACSGFVDDDQVFAVIAGSQFQIGAECVAREKRTPVITSDGVLDETYQRSEPFLYTLQPSASRLIRNWVHWMQARGLLDGATIGVYNESTTEQRTIVESALQPTLESLGQQIAVRHETDQSLGGPQDNVAVQRFQTEGVDLALLLTSKAGFMRSAQNADYHPTYVDSDYNSGTSNTATSQYPPEQFDGTQALTAMRWGEWVAGMPQTQPAQACVAYYEAKTGRRVDPSEREAEWVGMNKACDTGWVLLDALEHAGPNLTPESLVTGIQAITDKRLGMHLDVSFGSGVYSGFTRQRTLSWAAGCGCWSPVEGTDGGMWVR